MTYLLLSLRRPYTALMLAGKKTLEIRKTAPKAAQTAPADLRVLLYETRSAGGCGMVLGMVRCRAVHPVRGMDLQEVCARGCLTSAELYQYAAATGRSTAALLAWEVAEPVTFPQPLPLTAFGVGCAPQSWRTMDPAAVNAALAKK